jgi:hypothetical protein
VRVQIARLDRLHEVITLAEGEAGGRRSHQLLLVPPVFVDCTKVDKSQGTAKAASWTFCNESQQRPFRQYEQCLGAGRLTLGENVGVELHGLGKTKFHEKVERTQGFLGNRQWAIAR